MVKLEPKIESDSAGELMRPPKLRVKETHTWFTMSGLIVKVWLALALCCRQSKFCVDQIKLPPPGIALCPLVSRNN